MSILSKLWKSSEFKQSNFEAGGLFPSRRLMTPDNMVVKSPVFVAPRKLDFRDMCIQTSDQLRTPHCAGFSTAGYIEVQNWKKLHYPQQVDGDAIYSKAKLLDGNNEDGTTLDSAAQAAIELNLIQGKVKFIGNSQNDIKFSIHSNSVCIAGFNITNEWNLVNKNTGEISDLQGNSSVLGGHAVLICGYNDRGIFIQNSWGSNWGLWGFALIPWNKVDSQFMYGVVII